MITLPKGLMLFGCLSLTLALAAQSSAQSFTVLHSFTEEDGDQLNSDGAGPGGGPVASGTSLYGSAFWGGNYGGGTLFSLSADSTGFAPILNFDYHNNGPNNPLAGLILSGNTLYGTTYHGGNSHGGTVYAVNTYGTGFTILHAFSLDNDGGLPRGELLLSGNTLYGTTYAGGSKPGTSGSGVVFAVNIDGNNFRTLHVFTPLTIYGTNTDGAWPNGGLVLSGDVLYGTTSAGGPHGGTVFAVNTDGTGFKVLYGTGGGPGAGVFALNTNGDSFRIVYSFSEPNTNSLGVYTNSDGYNPIGGLVLAGNTLYGTTYDGGRSGRGTIFAVNIDGTGFTTLHHFSATSTNSSGVDTNYDGVAVSDRLTITSNTLYGAARRGGAFGNGTLFSLSLPPHPPRLMIISDGSGGYFIHAQGSPNFSCRLQRAPTINGPWASSAPQTADASGWLEFHDLFAPMEKAFYRTLQQ